MIGPARPDEMDTICSIAQVAWEPIHEAIIDDVGEALHDVLSGDWKERKAAQIRRQYGNNPEWVLAIRESEQVVGFVTFAIDQALSIGTIHNNAVRPASQSKGIASAMYAHVLELFRREGLKYARVGTGLDPGHAPARRAYEKAGFNLRSEEVTYYQEL